MFPNEARWFECRSELHSEPHVWTATCGPLRYMNTIGLILYRR